MICSKQSSIVYIAIFLVVGCIGLLSGLLVRNFAFIDNRFNVYPYPSDVRLVREKISTVFCSSIVLHSLTSGTLTAYKFSGEPKRQSELKTFHNTKLYLRVHSSTFQHWEYYLNKHSEYSFFLHNVDVGATLIVIKGWSKYKEYIQKGSRCSDCFHAGPEECYAPSCSDVGIRKSVQEDGEYFFIVKNNDKYYDAEVSVNLAVSGREYDLSTYIDRCSLTTSCALLFTFSSNEIVAVRSNQNNVISVMSRCNPNNWGYVLYFGVVPAYVGLMLVVVAVFHFRMKRLKAQRERVDRAPLDTAYPVEIMSGHTNVTIPSYEEAVATIDVPPPAYSVR